MTNYQRLLDEELKRIAASGKTPRLLLHACCAPCSSYVLEYLSEYFSITIFYFNPNITIEAEYRKRVREEQRLIAELPCKNAVTFMEGRYVPEEFFALTKGMEHLPEGGERCFKCYELRLRETAAAAKDGGFDYFTTTLSISPRKNAEKLNEIGSALSTELGVSYLFSDFKKKNGYKRSIELSHDYNLYRQDYCGCIYSRNEAETRKKISSDDKKGL